MNPASILVLIIIIAVVAAIVVHLWRNRGNPCCNCSSQDCPARKNGKKPSSNKC